MMNKLAIRLAALAATLMLGAASPGAPDAAVGTMSLAAITIAGHKLSGVEMVEVEKSEYAASKSGGVRVTISPAGDVVDVRPETASLPPSPTALAAARQWKFRPFTWSGRPVTVIGNINVETRLKPVWARLDAAFPAVDYTTLRIELTRTGCSGLCPAYKVSIDGDGNVLFSSRAPAFNAEAALRRGDDFGHGVLVGGEHRGTIDRATLDALIDKFRRARFFGLKPRYVYPNADSPIHVTFASGGRAMTVEDNVGGAVDMPGDLTALEAAIDDAAGTARWVKGDATTVAALMAEGLDPAGRYAPWLAVKSIHVGGDRTVLDLIAAGLPLDRPFAMAEGKAARSLGVELLVGALQMGHSRLAQALIDRGWAAKASRADLNLALASGAGGCSPGIARSLVAAGADPKARIEGDGSVSYDNSTLLWSATNRYGVCIDTNMDWTAMVGTLVSLGVDLDARDSDGRTLLFRMEDPEILRALLAGGARADVKDRNGVSPVFRAPNDEIALTLLEAGANPTGRYDGKTLRQVLARRDMPMPATIAWLDARGIQ